jgi:Homeodomain-like domain-containing protein
VAGETVTVKKYVVKLSEEGRNRLNEMIHKGKSSAQTPMKARILLKADVSEAGEGWSDSRIIEALETSATTVHRTRRQLAEEGLDAVLTASKGHGPRYRRFSTGRRKRS